MVNLSSAIFDNRALALLTGNNIVTGAEEVYQREVVTVVDDSGKKAVLAKTPKNGALIGVYKLGTDGVEGQEFTVVASTPSATQYTIAGKTLEFHTSVDVGTRIVAYFIADTANTTQTLTVSSDKFPGAFKMVMEVLVTDFHTKQLYPAQITIPSCKVEDNWSLSFAPDGDPEPMTMPIEVLQPADSTDMFTMKIYDRDTVV